MESPLWRGEGQGELPGGKGVRAKISRWTGASEGGKGQPRNLRAFSWRGGRAGPDHGPRGRGGLEKSPGPAGAPAGLGAKSRRLLLERQG